MIDRWRYVFCVCLLAISVAKGQEFELQLNSGFVLPHHAELKRVIKGYTSGFQLSYAQRTNGTKYWHRDFAYPKYGIALKMLDFGNKKELGSTLGMYPYFEFIMQRRNLSGTFALGWGPTYNTKIFDVKNNVKNFVISNRFSSLVVFNLDINYLVKNQISFGVGLGLNHVSNTAYRVPNWGINVVEAHTSVAYLFKPWQIDTTAFLKKAKPWYWTLHNAIGLKENLPAGGPKYGAYHMGIKIGKVLNRRSHLESGPDFYYNIASGIQVVNSDFGYSSHDVANGIKLGWGLVHVFQVGKIGLTQGIGVYVFNRLPDDGLWYSKLGTEVALNNNFSLLLNLYANKTKADFFGFGLQYKWVYEN